MSSKTTYQSISLLFQNGNIIAFCFVFFLISNPVVNNFIELEINEYELFDTSEKETTSEKVSVSDFEDEIVQYYFRDIDIQLNINQSKSFYVIGQAFLNFNPDIQLPPPRV